MRYISISRFVIAIIGTKEGEGMRLRDLREDRDLTQKTVADFLHIKQNTYSQYENGQRQVPLDVLVRLAVYFDTSTDYILGLTDEGLPYPRTKK